MKKVFRILFLCFLAMAPFFSFLKESRNFSFYLAPASPFLKAPQSFLDLVGSICVPKTLSLIFDSLGSFAPDFAGCQYPLTEEPQKKRGVLFFELHERGMNFFNELVGKDILPRAYVLTYQTARWGRVHLNLGNPKIFPYGILLCDGALENSYFFDLRGLFSDEINVLSLPCQEEWGIQIAHFFSRIFYPQASLPRRFGLARVRTALLRDNVPPGKLARFKGDTDVELFSLFRDNHCEVEMDLFDPRSSYSQDFQTALLMQPDRVAGKRVMEIGVGSGVNLLWALKLGACAVQGTDVSQVHVCLTRWNLQCAQERKQIPPHPFEIQQAKGFGTLPAADLYLFNAPGIQSREAMKGIYERAIAPLILVHSNYMCVDVIFPLLEELARRLCWPGTQALWRILSTKEALLADVTKKELKRSRRSLDTSYMTWSRAAAIKCLKQLGLAAQEVDLSMEHYPGLFWIEASFETSL